MERVKSPVQLEEHPWFETAGKHFGQVFDVQNTQIKYKIKPMPSADTLNQKKKFRQGHLRAHLRQNLQNLIKQEIEHHDEAPRT